MVDLSKLSPGGKFLLDQSLLSCRIFLPKLIWKNVPQEGRESMQSVMLEGLCFLIREMPHGEFLFHH